jgi:hypothetical protein
MSAERARRRAGFSLVEASIVTAVVALMLGAAVVREAVRSNGGPAVVRSNLFARLDRGLRSLAADFKFADLDAPSERGDSLSYQLPIRIAAEQGATATPDTRGPTEWGIVCSGVPINGGRATLRFVADCVLDEARLGIDLNGDGDQRDQFEQGHLERLLPDGAIEQLTGSWILQPAGDHGDDIDGDGKVDPIFSVDVTGSATIARLSLYVAVPTAGGSFLVERVDRSFACPNDRP